MTDQPIQWTEPGIPQQYALLVANTTTGDTRPATVDDLRRSAKALGWSWMEADDE